MKKIISYYNSKIEILVTCEIDVLQSYGIEWLVAVNRKHNSQLPLRWEDMESLDNGKKVNFEYKGTSCSAAIFSHSIMERPMLCPFRNKEDDNHEHIKLEAPFNVELLASLMQKDIYKYLEDDEGNSIEQKYSVECIGIHDDNDGYVTLSLFPACGGNDDDVESVDIHLPKLEYLLNGLTISYKLEAPDRKYDKMYLTLL
ncbi:MAG: hypothetical protein LUC26_00400 [Prevotella sp.]|nr:hypothetical protein [Prevotella sp.]